MSLRKTLSLAALAWALSALTMVESSPESHAATKKGIELYNKGKVAEAIAEFKKACSLDPKNADYHRNLSAVLKQNNQLPDALKEGELAVKNKPGDAKNLENLGDVLLALKKYPEAEKQYRAALKLAPKNADIANHLGSALSAISNLHLKAKKKDEAEKVAREAVKVAGKNPDTHIALANVLKDRGKDDDAVKEYEVGLSLSPSPDQIKYIKESVNYIKTKVDKRIP